MMRHPCLRTQRRAPKRSDCYTDCRPSAYTLLGEWDGAWTTTTTGPGTQHEDLLEVDGELIAVGTEGHVDRWSGSDWEELHGGEIGTLRAVAADGEGLVAVGDYRLVVRGPLDDLVVENVGGDFEDVKAAGALHDRPTPPHL